MRSSRASGVRTNRDFIISCSFVCECPIYGFLQKPFLHQGTHRGLPVRLHAAAWREVREAQFHESPHVLQATEGPLELPRLLSGNGRKPRVTEQIAPVLE